MGHVLVSLAVRLLLSLFTASAPEPGWLGVRLSAAPESPDGPRVRVDLVFAGSAAEKAGVKAGDLVSHLDRVPVASVEAMIETVRQRAAGSTLVVEVQRGTERHVLSAALLARPDPQALLRQHWIGKPWPAELGFVDARAGQPVGAGAWRGRPAVIDYWATTCGPCRAMMPDLKALAERHAKEGLVVVSISDEDQATLAGFLSQQPAVTHAIWSDGEHHLARTFWLSVMPTLFFLDRDGQIRSVAFGRQSLDELTTQVRALLGAGGL